MICNKCTLKESCEIYAIVVPSFCSNYKPKEDSDAED